MPEYRLSDDMSVSELEELYRNVLLKEDFYNEEYGSWAVTRAFKDAPKLLKKVFSPKKHLDIGCGRGALVSSMRKTGIESYGIDFSPALIEQAKKKTRPYLQAGAIEDATSLMQDVDLITCLETFEHLPVSSIESTLAAMSKNNALRVLLTIPSYGHDPLFGLGIEVNDDNPGWIRDMKENRLFRNIVLEDGKPHHGHITLASYRWWTEFFLSRGFARSRDLERTCVDSYKKILKDHHWNPYIIQKAQTLDAFDMSSGVSLGSGWHDFEHIQDSIAGRWTDGLAQIQILSNVDAIAHLELEVVAPSINTELDCTIQVTVDHLEQHDEYQFSWARECISPSVSILERECRTHVTLPMQQVGEVNDGVRTHCRRISIMSPSFVPRKHELSKDNRRLGVFVSAVAA